MVKGLLDYVRPRPSFHHSGWEDSRCLISITSGLVSGVDTGFNVQSCCASLGLPALKVHADREEQQQPNPFPPLGKNRRSPSSGISQDRLTRFVPGYARVVAQPRV